ncbi:MAG: sugar ABC transporter substrate-binding protein, partial [Armatimonadetes bacterium]|nr:sugar ABC transporter substrate-binding protein [Armatimonadota bacterium]
MKRISTLWRNRFLAALVLGTALLAFSLAGAASARTKVVYGAPTGSTDQVTVSMFFKPFMTLHPNIEMVDAGFPRGGYEERLLAQFSAGQAEVDLFTEWGAVEEFMDRDLVVPLDGSHNPKIKLDEATLRDLYPGARAIFTYPQISSKRTPRLYCLPANASDAMVLMYNEELFKKAGLPGPPKTWQERLDYGKKLTIDVNGDGVIDVWGYAYQGSPAVMAGKEVVQSFVNALFTSGGKYLDDKGMPAFDSAIGVKALEHIVDLKLKHKIVPPGASQYTFAEVRDLIATGKGAMAETYVSHAIFVNTNPASTVRGKVMIAPLPYLTKPGGYTHAGGLCIPKASKVQEEAFTFLKYIASKPVQWLFSLTLRDTTSRVSVGTDPEMIAEIPDERTRKMFRIYDGVAKHATAIPLFPGGSAVIRALG